MYTEIFGHKVMQIIGQYGIVKVKEKTYFSDGTQLKGKQAVYDVCLEHGEGDIVASFDTLKMAKKWAKEN